MALLTPSLKFPQHLKSRSGARSLYVEGTLDRQMAYMIQADTPARHLGSAGKILIHSFVDQAFPEGSPRVTPWNLGNDSPIVPIPLNRVRIFPL